MTFARRSRTAMNQERAWSFGQNPAVDDREEQNEDGDELDTLEIDEVELKEERLTATTAAALTMNLRSAHSMAGSASCDGVGPIGVYSGRAAISNTTNPNTKSVSRICRTTTDGLARPSICWGGFWAVPLFTADNPISRNQNRGVKCQRR